MTPNQTPQHLRICLDLGSGQSKSYLYSEDTTTNTITKIESFIRICPYQKYVTNSYLAPEGMYRGIEALVKIQNHYGLNFTQTKNTGIATAWARNAANGPEFIAFLNQNLGTNIDILSQKEEGQRAFEVVEKDLIKQRVAVETLTVFDVGGGSYQINFRGADGEINTLKGDYGIETAKKDVFGIAAPNRFLTTDEIAQVREVAQDKIFPFLSQETKELPFNFSEAKVFGIGGVFIDGPKNVMGQDFTHSNQTIPLAEKLSEFNSFEEARELFPETRDITNIQYSQVFINVLMETLGVDTLHLSFVDFCLG